MDLKYLFTIPSFLVGVFVGFQFIYQKYDEDPVRAAVTIPGFVYLFTRGAVPVGVFVLLYGLQLMPHPLWLWSLICGTAGTELILRARIFVREDRSPEGDTRELMYGPLDLLQWYQNLFLESIKKRLPTYRGEYILGRVKAIIPDNMNFSEMCEKIRNNAYIYIPKHKHLSKTRNFIRKPKQGIHEAIEQSVNECKADFDATSQIKEMTAKLDKAFQYKLGYSIMDLPRVGERGLKLLIS